MEEERTREKRRRRERIEWFSTKMHAILWVAASVTTIYLTDLVNVIMYSQDVDRCVPQLEFPTMESRRTGLRLLTPLLNAAGPTGRT